MTDHGMKREIASAVEYFDEAWSKFFSFALQNEWHSGTAGYGQLLRAQDTGNLPPALPTYDIDRRILRPAYWAAYRKYAKHFITMQNRRRWLGPTPPWMRKQIERDVHRLAKMGRDMRRPLRYITPVRSVVRPQTRGRLRRRR
jgi:hypothetical protein